MNFFDLKQEFCKILILFSCFFQKKISNLGLKAKDVKNACFALFFLCFTEFALCKKNQSINLR
jgi:hypothetical protein